MLDKKLQIKEGQTVALLGDTPAMDLAAARAPIDQADAIIIFVANKAELEMQLAALQVAAQGGKLTWLAYPKAKQLNTDLNRDILRDIANQHGLDPVRQIAIDDTWSALRLKSL